MSEMIERVAKAIEAEFDRMADIPYYRPSNETLARVAISAMRQPTEQMLEVCWSISPSGDGEGGCWMDKHDAGEFWKKMLEAAMPK